MIEQDKDLARAWCILALGKLRQPPEVCRHNGQWFLYWAGCSILIDGADDCRNEQAAIEKALEVLPL